MKHILFLFGILCGFALAADPKVPAPQLEIEARLVEIPGKMPKNDLYNYVYVFRYKVIRVIQGSYSGKEILVGQYNPLMARTAVKDKMDAFVNGNLQSFKAGEVHSLKLVKPMESVWKEALEDEYFDDNSDRWFAIETNAVK